MCEDSILNDYLLEIIDTPDTDMVTESGWVCSWDVRSYSYEHTIALRDYGFIISEPDYTNKVLYIKVTITGLWWAHVIKRRRQKQKELYGNVFYASG